MHASLGSDYGYMVVFDGRIIEVWLFVFQGVASRFPGTTVKKCLEIDHQAELTHRHRTAYETRVACFIWFCTDRQAFPTGMARCVLLGFHDVCFIA